MTTFKLPTGYGTLIWETEEDDYDTAVKQYIDVLKHEVERLSKEQE